MMVLVVCSGWYWMPVVAGRDLVEGVGDGDGPEVPTSVGAPVSSPVAGARPMLLGRAPLVTDQTASVRSVENVCEYACPNRPSGGADEVTAAAPAVVVPAATTVAMSATSATSPAAVRRRAVPLRGCAVPWCAGAARPLIVRCA